MAIKEPWVSVKFTCKLENKPKNYAGITSETFGIAHDKPVPLSTMIVGFAINLSEFHYATTNSIEQINEQLKIAANRLSKLQCRPKNEAFNALDEMSDQKEAGNQ
jgi:hypothetical protein